jgi:hypothetical protein
MDIFRKLLRAGSKTELAVRGIMPVSIWCPQLTPKSATACSAWTQPQTIFIQSSIQLLLINPSWPGNLPDCVYVCPGKEVNHWREENKREVKAQRMKPEL